MHPQPAARASDEEGMAVSHFEIVDGAHRRPLDAHYLRSRSCPCHDGIADRQMTGRNKALAFHEEQMRLRGRHLPAACQMQRQRSHLLMHERSQHPLRHRFGRSAFRCRRSAVGSAVQEMSSVLYTPSVTNTPSQIERDISSLRHKLLTFYVEPLHREEEALQERVRQYERQRRHDREALLLQHDWRGGPLPEEPPWTELTLAEIGQTYLDKRHQIQDPTRLVIVDEADRLRIGSLEQLRSLFDMGDIGLVLLGMPGLEKRLVRYPQFYSRVGFVHEFRPLSVAEVRLLLEQQWKPTEVCQPLEGMTDEDVLVAIVRITGGNFRLLHRLLSQIARVQEINDLSRVTLQVVDAARESLVIGTV